MDFCLDTLCFSSLQFFDDGLVRQKGFCLHFVLYACLVFRLALRSLRVGDGVSFSALALLVARGRSPCPHRLEGTLDLGPVTKEVLNMT